MDRKVDWIVLIPDHENAREIRLANRQAHLDGLTARVQSGVWTMGGATFSHKPVDDNDKPYNGSCIVAHAASEAEVLEEVKKDVYATAGVWNLGNITIRPLMTAFRKEMAGSKW